MIEAGKCNTPLFFITLLAGNINNPKINLRFQQQIGFNTIKWSPEELMKKPLIDLLAMDNMRYVIEEIEITLKTLNHEQA